MPRPSIAGRLLAILSGYGLATILLLLLGLLTWLATLEQIDSGLHHTLRKYFHWQAFYLVPEIYGELLPLVLPGGYWVCALLLVNLTLGGLRRLRQGWSHAGVLIAHCGIIYLLVAGAVAHHFSERGNLLVAEGTASNVADDYFEHVVEVAEVQAGKPAAIQVIRGQYLTDLEGLRSRTFRLSAMPFDLELARYFPNAEPKSVLEQAPPEDLRPYDGYYLMAKPDEVKAEANTPGCIARILYRDGRKSESFLLSSAAFQPFTVRHEDRVFTVHLRKRQWLMPFTVRLDKFTAEFHPGTMKPAKFVSEITRLEDGKEAKAVIQMNEPMRYANLTFFQASYQRLGQGPSARMASVFEVVRNPADQWPQYSLYVVSCGLLVHFLTKLAGFIKGLSRQPNHV
ncbi:MAG: cytochrome c biogenesis protein ResB [Verrucomicrobia bacterium]|nr:cytochrome c biogenesis protein ResB [Verrucomicrobiota bacterium]